MTQIGETVSVAIAAPDAPPANGNATLLIRETSSDEPVKDVTVSIKGPSSASGTTDANGEVTFSGLTPGVYAFTLTQDEFEMSPENGSFGVQPGADDKHEIAVARVMTTLVLKRLHIKGFVEAVRTKSTDPIDYGHWWIELDGSESYGWWPKEGVSLVGTFTGVPGSLNGQGPQFRGSPTRDPHHGDQAEEMFHPRVTSGAAAADIKASIRSFARSYSGNWSWPWGQNCHSFQKSLMKECKLTKSRSRKL